MIAPADLERAAAERLLAPVGDTARHFLEGPERYMPQDVADAFASALARDVFVQVAAREQWPTVYEQAGFFDATARSHAKMIATILGQGFGEPLSPSRGPTPLRGFINAAMVGGR